MSKVLEMVEELRRIADDAHEPEFDPENVVVALRDIANRLQEEDTRAAKAEETAAMAEDAAAEYRQALEALMKITTPGEREWLNPVQLLEIVHSDSAKMLRREAGRQLRSDVREIERVVKEFEGKETNHWRMGDEPLSKRVLALVSFYQRTAAQSLSDSRAFLDDVLTWLRSFGMVVEMAGNAGTHAEKNARLRGLSELLESAAHKLQNSRVEFGYRWYEHVDVFKTDYPVRHFVERIHELEHQLKQLQPQNGHEES